MTQASPALDATPPRGGDVVRRHRLSTRVWHWVNVVAFFIMLMSGLMIFNAHPRLYWGEYGANFDPAWLEIGAEDGRGYLRVGELSLDTTGVLGTQTVDRPRAEPRLPRLGDDPLQLRPGAVAALAPDLRLGLRRSASSPTASGASSTATSAATCCRGPPSSAPGHVWHDIKAHATLNFPRGEAARRYNVLQKLAYLGVLAVLIPVMILTGLTMSPSMDATWPWLLDLFGGRQSARSIHFIAAWALVALPGRPPGHGGAGRTLQRDPLDDHRPLPPARGEELMPRLLTRRALLRGAGLAAPALILGGCDWLGASPSFRDIVLGSGEWLTYRAQRLIGSEALAREYDPSEMSPRFRTNGNTQPRSPDYRRHAEAGFADWRLRLDGLVETPLDLSLAELRALPSRSQITRHDCVEGWSAIGKWTGVPLGHLLDAVRLQPQARYLVFHCADDFSSGLSRTAYYESIDLVDAFHPQTILAYGMNDAAAPHRPRRAAAPARRAPARLQARQVRHARRGGGEPRRHRPRQRRLLGGHRQLRLVRRDLTPEAGHPSIFLAEIPRGGSRRWPTA